MSRAMVDLRLVLTANHSDPPSVSASWRLPQRLSHLTPFTLLGMRDKSYDATGVVYYDDRGAYMRVLLIHPLDPDPVELRVGRPPRRVRAHVVLGGAFLRVVPRGDAARHDVAIGDGAEVAAVFRIVHDRHDRDVLHAHQRGHLGAGGAGGGDVGIGNHHLGCAQPDLPGVRPDRGLDPRR